MFRQPITAAKFIDKSSLFVLLPGVFSQPEPPLRLAYSALYLLSALLAQNRMLGVRAIGLRFQRILLATQFLSLCIHPLKSLVLPVTR